MIRFSHVGRVYTTRKCPHPQCRQTSPRRSLAFSSSTLRASFPLKVRQLDSLPRPAFEPGPGQGYVLNAASDGTPHQAVEPVVVRPRGAEFPLVDRPATGLGLHAVLGRQVLGEQPIRLGVLAEQGQAARIAYRHGQASMWGRVPGSW